ncbi:hypothetical protein ABZW10_22060 [Kitasatospora sp. NPDC004723]|uniref:hypothetical protein n=1 Tax=Kitasatospora sp. NPDC004723 TaxID=3154288 RepID=UPI0033BBC4CC
MRGRPPKGFRIPTDRETALAFGEPVAVLRDAPAEWVVTVGRQGVNGFVYRIDVGYHLPGGEPVATVSTVRSSPEYPQLPQHLDPTEELHTFLANSDRPAEAVGRVPYLSRDARLGPLRIPVHVHHRQDCFGTRLPRFPHETGCIVVAGLTAHWPVLSALVLREPADFPDTHLLDRQP